MSPAVATRKRSQTRRKKRRPYRLWWWPLPVALLATPFLVRAASVLALSGPAALQLLFPWVVLVQRHLPGQPEALAQAAMWVQFPVYGLLAVLVARWRGSLAGLLTAGVLHALGIVLALLWGGS